jgi:Domain of unknown function (DUF222)
MCTTDPAPVRQLQDALSGLTQVDPSSSSDESLRSALPTLLTAFHQLAAVVSGVIGAFDARDLSQLDACRTAKTWLESFGRMTPNAASAWVKRARLLGSLPALRAATLAGTVTADHLRRVFDLIGRVGLVAVVPFDELLANLAATVAPADVQKACDYIAAHIDPDGPDPDPHGAFQRRGLTLARVGGMIVLRGQLDPEAGAALLTALDAAMAPPKGDDLRTPAQRRADALMTIINQILGAGELPTVHSIRPHLGILITPDTLLSHAPSNQPEPADDEETTRARLRHLLERDEDTPGHSTDRERRADPPPPDRNDEGATTADRHGQADDAPPSDRGSPDDEPPDIGHRRTDPPMEARPRPGSDAAAAWQALFDAGVPGIPEPARLDWFGDIHAAIAQRIACDCDIWRCVLDPTTGLPLEVGRTHRIVPHWIRKALHARDQGCRFPGCTAPVAWTDAHHWKAWYHGGETNIDNLLSLCRFHHVIVHEGRWTLAPDRTTGAVYAYRPDGTPYELGPSLPHISPTRRPGDPPPRAA